MTNYDETAGADDPAALLEELRQSIEAENDSPDLSEELTDNEAWGHEHLEGLTLDSPAVVVASADLMIHPLEPSPQARARMIETANRALAERRRMHGLLPVLLRNVREQNSQSQEEIATQADLTRQTIEELESGEKEINLNLPVETIVSWIEAVGGDQANVLAALRRSLEAGWTGELALAAGILDRPTNVDAYVEAVAERVYTKDERES